MHQIEAVVVQQFLQKVSLIILLIGSAGQVVSVISESHADDIAFYYHSMINEPTMLV